MCYSINPRPAESLRIMFARCRKVFLGGLAFCLFLSPGCGQRRMPPELIYSDSNVQLIRREMEKVDWE